MILLVYPFEPVEKWQLTKIDTNMFDDFIFKNVTKMLAYLIFIRIFLKVNFSLQKVFRKVNEIKGNLQHKR